MTVPTDRDTESVVVLADLRHDRVPVDPCDNGKGNGTPMDPHGDYNGVSVDPLVTAVATIHHHADAAF